MPSVVSMDAPSIPSWVWEFHGHICPFMPIGYRMGRLAMKELGVEREKDHGMLAFSEMGVGHPNTCMNDGIQAATGCTYGKLLMERLSYGKCAFVLYKEGKGAIRISIKTDFIDILSKTEFSALRKQGVEPSEIPQEIADATVRIVSDTPDNEMLNIERIANFKFGRTPVRFNKARCSKCGEYVFERYVKMVDGKPLCIPCSGYEQLH